MTIVTKPLTGEKKPEPNGNVAVPPLVYDGKHGLDAENAGTDDERLHYVLQNRNNRNRKMSSATTLCLLITALLVMTVGLFGGLYIYKQMSRNRIQNNRFRGWCNVPYSEARSDPLSETLLRKKIDSDGLSYNFGDDAEMNKALADFFKEEFELDLEDEKYAKIEVPDFKNGRMGRFIHEFETNKTAIVDITGNRCFVMPLDREKVMAPKNMFDMLQKMVQGHYTVNTNQIRESMRVVKPPVEDLSNFGTYIQQECSTKTTYTLEKSTGRIVKRSVSSKNSLPFTEFAGKHTIQYDIENIDDLDP